MLIEVVTGEVESSGGGSSDLKFGAGIHCSGFFGRGKTEVAAVAVLVDEVRRRVPSMGGAVFPPWETIKDPSCSEKYYIRGAHAGLLPAYLRFLRETSVTPGKLSVSVGRYESGKNSPSIDALEAILGGLKQNGELLVGVR